MPDYLLKDIPEATKNDFKTACAHFKKTMRYVLLDTMTLWIKEYKRDMGYLRDKQRQSKKTGGS